MGDEGFIAGDAYPSLDGESADNLTDVPGADLDTLAGDDEEEGEDDEESEKPSAGDECAELRDKNLRLQAEFDNFRKRTLKERMELLQFAGADTVKQFLPLLDDVQRAVSAMEKSDDIAALREGVNLIAQKFTDTLKNLHVEEVDALGLELDTDRHEAVARVPGDKGQSGKIIDVVQKGYKIGDKVLRFAKVVVGE